MTSEEALRIRDRKCVTFGCYHFHEQGVIYCNHCLHGSCRVMSFEQKEEYENAEKLLDEIAK